LRKAARKGFLASDAGSDTLACCRFRTHLILAAGMSISSHPSSAVDSSKGPILALGAHPDDLEFSVGAVLAGEGREGRLVRLALCSRGECASHGTAELRAAEAAAGAEILGAELEFVDFPAALPPAGGDCRLQGTPSNALAIAGLIRRHKPALLLAPTPSVNQHPDHAALSGLARDAARLARYGGIPELRDLAPHAIQVLLFYAVTPDAEPRDITPIFIDVSAPEILDTWTRAMRAHESQQKTRGYVDLQLTRARLNGHRIGPPVTHAIALYPADPPVFSSLGALGKSARHF